MIFSRWPTVYDACPTLKQHWMNASDQRIMSAVHRMHQQYFTPYRGHSFIRSNLLQILFDFEIDLLIWR